MMAKQYITRNLILYLLLLIYRFSAFQEMERTKSFCNLQTPALVFVRRNSSAKCVGFSLSVHSTPSSLYSDSSQCLFPAFWPTFPCGVLNHGSLLLTLLSTEACFFLSSYSPFFLSIILCTMI